MAISQSRSSWYGQLQLNTRILTAARAGTRRIARMHADPESTTEALHRSRISSTDAKARTVEIFKTQARLLADTMESLTALGMDMEVTSTLEKLRSPSSGKEQLNFGITVVVDLTGQAPSPAAAKHEIHIWRSPALGAPMVCEVCGEVK